VNTELFTDRDDRLILLLIVALSEYVERRWHRSRVTPF